MATPEEIRRAREATAYGGLFNNFFATNRAYRNRLAQQGRRPVLGGLLSKEPVMGTDTLRYEGIRPFVGNLLEPIIKGGDTVRASRAGLIPQQDMIGEAFGAAGAAMLGGGLAAKPAGSLGVNASKSAGLLSVASDVSARGDQILNMLKSGRGSEVTDAMLDMGDGVKNTQLNQYLAANYDLPLDEASRLARAREMGLLDVAYHSTGSDFQNFVPSEFRGASFFAATPEGASKGASASANEGVGSGSKITMPVRVDTSGVEGLGAYARKDMNEFRASLPDRIYTEAEVDALMASDAAPLRGTWSDFFDDLTDYDALRKFRDENPTKQIPDGIVKFRPKRPKSYDKDLKTDLSGRQFAHYSEGMSERPTSEYVKSQGNTGFTMMDESGLALAMVDPTKVRSQFARFDPRLSHLSNVTAANASKGSGAMTLWHGSPYDFNEFDLSKIGTGEGAQDLGRGFSLTDYEANAHLYTNPASRWGDLAAMERYRQAGPGRYYQVNVGAAPKQFLDWNKPWRDQVPEGTPLYDALAKEEAVMLSQYADDPAMQAAIPRGNVSNMWRDNSGLEDAALQSGFVGNSRRNYSGDTEYTVFDPSLLRIDQKFDADGNVVFANASKPVGLLVLEQQARGNNRLGSLLESQGMDISDLSTASPAKIQSALDTAVKRGILDPRSAAGLKRGILDGL